MVSSYLIAANVPIVLLVLFLLRTFLRSNRKLSLPPGPKGLPLVGNILDMPTEKEWLTFARWGETYGDICSVTVLGQPLIVVNSAKIATEMLHKKSAIYSDRPVLQMGGELVGWKDTMVLLPYSDRFRRYRRLFHNLIGTQTAVKRFHPVQETVTRRFLRRMLLSPDDFSQHVRWTVGAVILKISYGYEVKEQDDPFVQMADIATEQFSLSTAPGGFLVDLIPFLRHIPIWFPGAGFRRKANEWAATLQEMVDRPHNFVKQNMACGTAEMSFTSTILKGKQLSSEDEFIVKWSAASLYSGAADTTVSAINSFFLALALHPQVLEKAQAEIDAIIGPDRLPTYADRTSLPYLNALIMEVVRWHTVVPTAVAHRLMQDDIHEGYFIPKGALVLPNIWKMTHDPNVYKDPFEFNPERFLPPKGRAPEPDPREVCFGFGRRICPGLHLADASIFVTCAMTLAVFDISKCVENGVVIEPVHENTTGTISHPEPFKCSIKPRSERVLSLILADESWTDCSANR